MSRDSMEKVRTVLPSVLVINDLQTTLNLYADLLDNDQYELELSNYEFEDPKMIEMLKPSLIILDFQVEQSNRTRGWQLLDKIQLNRVTTSIPLIICTPSMQDIREQENYLEDQGLKIFYKPFNLDRFTQKVLQMLNLPLPEEA